MTNLLDTANAPTSEPQKIIAGDFLAWWRKDLSTDYPPTTYDLTYECRRSGEEAKSTAIRISASESEGHFLVSVSSTDSVKYAVGHYYWFAYITRTADGERVQVDHGEFDVLPDRATNNTDPASLPRRMIRYIEAALEGRATNHQLDVLTSSFGEGDSVGRDPEKLLKHLAYWRRRLARVNRKSAPRRIHMSF